MTRAQVTQAVGATATGAVGGLTRKRATSSIPRAPEGMLVMIQQDALTSLTLRNNTTLKTDRGFGVAMQARRSNRLWRKRAVAEPHKYVEGAEYITIWSAGAPSARGFVRTPTRAACAYETNAEGVVTAVHAGGPSIQNVEGS